MKVSLLYFILTSIKLSLSKSGFALCIPWGLNHNFILLNTRFKDNWNSLCLIVFLLLSFSIIDLGWGLYRTWSMIDSEHRWGRRGAGATHVPTQKNWKFVHKNTIKHKNRGPPLLRFSLKRFWKWLCIYDSEGLSLPEVKVWSQSPVSAFVSEACR